MSVSTLLCVGALHLCVLAYVCLPVCASEGVQVAPSASLCVCAPTHVFMSASVHPLSAWSVSTVI